MTRRPTTGPALAICVVAAALGLVCSACAPAICGEWTSPESSSHYENGTVYAPNRMTIGSDGTGKADIFYLLTEDPEQLVHGDQFEVEWSEDGSSAFSLAMSCFRSDVSPSMCEAHHFAMSCDSVAASSGSQASSLGCSGDGSWTGYQFVWEAVVSDD